MNITIFQEVDTVKGKGIVTKIDPDLWVGACSDPYRVEISIHKHLNNDIKIPIQNARDDKIIYWMGINHILN